MPLLPLKGQEVLLSVISPDTGREDELDHIKDMKFEFMLDIIQEQYLGQIADQFDEIFRGVNVEMTFDMADPAVLDFSTKVVNRAQRRNGFAAASQFQVTAAFAFPGGQRSVMLFPDLRFGSIPFDLAGRDKYAEYKLTAKTDRYRKL